MQLCRIWVLIALTFLGGVPAARADYLTGMVVFGDSLSDTGNLFAAAGAPGAPYYQGHFSNGPIWVESLAAKLGLPAPTPSSTGGTDFAWASAESGAGVSPSFGVPNLLTQVSSFTLKNKLTSHQLVTVWAGGNDFLDGQTNPFVPVNNIVSAITQLAQAGGKTFLVPNLPLLDQIPLSQSLTPAQQAGLRSLTSAFNSNLKTQLTQLEKTLGVTIYQVDVASLFNQIQANPVAYGFTNVTTSALGDGVLSGQGYLFWDGIHPTTAGHALIADAAFAQVAPEPSSLFLMATASVGMIVWRRRANKTHI